MAATGMPGLDLAQTNLDELLGYLNPYKRRCSYAQADLEALQRLLAAEPDIGSSR